MPDLQEIARTVCMQVMSILGERAMNQATEVFPIVPIQWDPENVI